MYHHIIANSRVCYAVTRRAPRALRLSTSSRHRKISYFLHHSLSADSPSSPLTAPAANCTPAATTHRSLAALEALGTSISGRPAEHPRAAVRSAYVHLPFCKRKCFYCDFPVEAVGRDTTAPKVEDRMRAYVDVLQREIAATRREGEGPLQTLFFGGGTPSLLPPSLLALILEALDSRFGLAGDAEVSLEADPGTFDSARLRQYRQLGITRLSVGVQAFQQDLLEACGRGHDLGDVEAALEAVHTAGLPSWSLDLISGLPGLTAAAWRHSLRRAIEAAPDHVSVYDLQVEEGTPFERWQRAGRLRLPPDDAAVEMYGEASELLRAAGFEHYEVSNYAQPGHRCAHNQVYWRGLPYYAFGLGAASYLAGRRFSRPARMRPYVAWVGELEAAAAAGGSQGVLPGGHLPAESQEELLLDTLMLRLRTADGLDLTQLRNRFGPQALGAVVRALAPHERRGNVTALDGGGRDCTLAEAALAAAVEPPPPPQGSGVGSRIGLDADWPGPGAGLGQASASTMKPAGRFGAGVGQDEVQVAGGRGVGPRVRLSDPGGLLLSNDVISDVFAAFDVAAAGGEDGASGGD